jgi:hypothetical protein
VSVLFTADNQAYRATTGLPGTVSTTIFWAYLVGTRAADGTMAVWNAGGTNGHNVEVNATTGVLHFDSITGGFDSSATFTAGVWRKVALVLNGTSATLYSANTGSALASVGTNTTTTMTYSDLYIGAFNNATSGVWFNGRIANLKVYNAVLTLAEMEAELASWTAIRTANLMRHHKFQVAETTDYSGNGNTLTGGTGATTAGDPAGLTTGVAFDAVGPSSAGQGTAAVTSITWSHTCAGSNRYVIVGASCSADAATLTATYGGVAMTPLGLVHSGGLTSGFIRLFGLVAPATGAATVIVTSSVSGDLSGGSISFTGVDQTTPVGTAVTATSVTTSVSAAVPGTIAGNMVAATAVYGAGIAVTPTQTSRYSKILNGNTAAGSNSGSTATSTGGTVTMGYSATNADDWGIIAVEVKAVAVVAASTGPTIRSVSSKGKVSGTDLTVAVTKPAGLALNDYILVLQASDADGGLAAMTAPSGFVTLASQAGGTTNNYGGMKIWGKVAVSADVAASTFTFNYDSAGDGAVIMIAITAGTYNTTTPITLAGTFTVQARIASAVQTVASMTGVANALLIGMLSTDTNGTVESYPSAGMTGFTLVASQIGIAAPFVLAGAYSKALVAAGATGASTVTPTGAGTSNGWVSTALLVNPLPDDGTSFFYELAA